MFTQKISMDCTQEQYEKYLKTELEKMGYESADDFNSMPCNGILTGWNDDYIIQSYNKGGIENDSRTYLGKFNAPLFLALAAMTDKMDGGYREYYIQGNYMLSLNENGFLGQNGLWRKAAREEIMAKFGEPKAEPITIAIDITNHSDEKRCYYGSEEQMISLLKSKGYKIFKQTTTLEEV